MCYKEQTFVILVLNHYFIFICFTLTGSNVTEARKILSESGLPITPADSFEDAAIKVTQSLQNAAAL